MSGDDGELMENPEPQDAALWVTTSHSLLRVTLPNGAVEIWHRGEGAYFGLARSPDGRLAVAARGRRISDARPRGEERGAVLLFDPAFARHEGTVAGPSPVAECWRPDFPLRDLHGLGFAYRSWWLICSLDDWIALRLPDGSWRRWWPLPVRGGGGWDRFHFNTLFFEDGAEVDADGPTEDALVWVLAHRHGPSWLLAFPAAAALRGETVPPVRWLQLGAQAHNIWRSDGVLWTCSSAEGRLVSEDGRSVVTGGFPRGIVRLEKAGKTLGWVIGVSALAERRRRDWTTGTLVLFDADWREQGRIELPGEGLVMEILPA